jgi:hypothetical protein
MYAPVEVSCLPRSLCLLNALLVEVKYCCNWTVSTFEGSLHTHTFAKTSEIQPID